MEKSILTLLEYCLNWNKNNLLQQSTVVKKQVKLH